MLLWGTVAAFGVATIVAGAGDAGRAIACDKKTSQSAAATRSCDAKSTLTTADAGHVHDAVIRSAVVAPGVAPVLNLAGLGGAVTAGDGDGCAWCPAGKCTTAEAAAGKAGCPVFASTAKCGAVKAVATAAGSGCRATSAAAAASCDKSAVKTAGAGSSCCASKTAHAAACEKKQLQSAAIKDGVDEIPYRENKRLVLTGNYACAHCALEITEACAPMFKTADGKVYPLMKSARATELRKAGAKNAVEVSVRVRKIEGVKYLDVKSFKSI
jgi:hypothetical protein